MLLSFIRASYWSPCEGFEAGQTSKEWEWFNWDVNFAFFFFYCIGNHVMYILDINQRREIRLHHVKVIMNSTCYIHP